VALRSSAVLFSAPPRRTSGATASPGRTKAAAMADEGRTPSNSMSATRRSVDVAKPRMLLAAGAAALAGQPETMTCCAPQNMYASRTVSSGAVPARVQLSVWFVP